MHPFLYRPPPFMVRGGNSDVRPPPIHYGRLPPIRELFNLAPHVPPSHRRRPQQVSQVPFRTSLASLLNMYADARIPAAVLGPYAVMPTQPRVSSRPSPSAHSSRNANGAPGFPAHGSDSLLPSPSSNISSPVASMQALTVSDLVAKKRPALNHDTGESHFSEDSSEGGQRDGSQPQNNNTASASLEGAQTGSLSEKPRRSRRRYDMVQRYYQCNYGTCTKSYGTLNHLNHHITLQGHGPRRHPAEFASLRRWLKESKKKGSPAMINQPLSSVGAPTAPPYQQQHAPFPPNNRPFPQLPLQQQQQPYIVAAAIHTSIAQDPVHEKPPDMSQNMPRRIPGQEIPVQGGTFPQSSSSGVAPMQGPLQLQHPNHDKLSWIALVAAQLNP